MDNKMTEKQYLDFIFGQIYVLKHLCSAMVALHPHRKTIFQLGKNVLDEAIDKNASEYRKDGIKDILEVVAQMVDSALISELVPKPGPDTRFH